MRGTQNAVPLIVCLKVWMWKICHHKKINGMGSFLKTCLFSVVERHGLCACGGQRTAGRNWLSPST